MKLRSVLISLVVSFILSSCSGNRSDNQLVGMYLEKKMVFEDLRRMLSLDIRLNAVGVDGFISPPTTTDYPVISPDRLVEYTEKLEQIGAKYIGIDRQTGTIRIALCKRTANPLRTNKGYIYLETAPASLEQDLSTPSGKSDANGLQYRLIEDGHKWYLYSQN